MVALIKAVPGFPKRRLIPIRMTGLTTAAMAKPMLDNRSALRVMGEESRAKISTIDIS
jgi:hypothetical protein